MRSLPNRKRSRSCAISMPRRADSENGARRVGLRRPHQDRRNPGRAMGTTGKINTARLADIVGPRSVAVVGASEDLGKFGGRALHHLIKHGFQSRIVPINPKRPNLFVLPAAPTIVAAGSVDV